MEATPSALPDAHAVEAWAQEHFGLTLENYPPGRGAQLASLLAQHPPGTWDALTDEAARILSIPETHFQRHPECFDVARQLLREVAQRRPSGPVRIWSAGCASGEEAYNLAALGLEEVGTRVQVFGTDFSHDAVARAREGVYGSWSLRGIEPSALAWLELREGRQVRVKDEIRAQVTFCVGTLAEPGPPYDIDLAFCRNVLIYFSDEGSGRVLRRIAASLRSHGHLIMAPTDPEPTELKRWTRVHRPAKRSVRSYQPPEGAYQPSPTPPAAASGAPRQDIQAGDLAKAIRDLLGG